MADTEPSIAAQAVKLDVEATEGEDEEPVNEAEASEGNDEEAEAATGKEEEEEK